ncbi:nuclear transport factor 2 family protein [Pendulispora albinea]|uniref:Nuclear transport factor 2 family protein n=1 Tax=Pendulispora albinea TaxID=2741071 RepID=A0ABZ2LVE9_9BACT
MKVVYHNLVVGTVVIEGDGDEATAEWYWMVVFRKGVPGIVATGTYYDKLKKIEGAWKCVHSRHAVDANWPRKYFEDLMAEHAARSA